MMEFNVCINFRQFDADKQRLRDQLNKMAIKPENLEEYNLIRDEYEKLLDFQDILLHYWM